MHEPGRTWPSQADYIMALQDPAAAFADPLLAGGDIESDSVLGLPKPRSGQMASVYKVRTARATWAVRCFNFASVERAARYSAISAFLDAHPNPYTVGFAYRDMGIIVDGRPYPIVKMEWVEGDLLPAYIAKHLDAPDVLEGLAAGWIELVRDLHALGLAHGDLQHGNVLVTPEGKLKLIDYDGMFVPALAGARGSEVGHPNYQHPCRDLRHFGPQLDNFSAWVVYLSIAAVVRDRTAWTSLRFGDECLALRRPDYVRPSSSDAFAQLAAASGPDDGKLARYLQSMLPHEPDALPALETCMRSAPAGAGGPRGAARFTPVAFEPSAASVYREPYLPETPTQLPPPGPAVKPPRAALAAGAGVAATGAGYAVFHALGFVTEQYAAIVVLGWALAGILALASRSAKPGGG
jgi:hypothetical protein